VTVVTPRSPPADEPRTHMETDSRSTVITRRRCATLPATVFLVLAFIAGIMRASEFTIELKMVDIMCLAHSGGASASTL